jgi:hypothetical protein
LRDGVLDESFEGPHHYLLRWISRSSKAELESRKGEKFYRFLEAKQRLKKDPDRSLSNQSFTFKLSDAKVPNL